MDDAVEIRIDESLSLPLEGDQTALLLCDEFAVLFSLTLHQLAGALLDERQLFLGVALRPPELVDDRLDFFLL
ncbi:hypothetical protein B7Z00_02930 [Candidatus Saccharibacteria bacterium 32-50-10]|nr:MAG: hypothetical protein B7Z00_02930 [Candidatus Saccharibacteria bacterium 32-50-10]